MVRFTVVSPVNMFNNLLAKDVCAFQRILVLQLKMYRARDPSPPNIGLYPISSPKGPLCFLMQKLGNVVVH